MPRLRVRLPAGLFPSRPLCFFLSLAIHCFVVTMIVLRPPTLRSPKEELRGYQVKPLPKEIAVLFYQPPGRKLPIIEPDKRFGESPRPTGRVLSQKEVMVVNQPPSLPDPPKLPSSAAPRITLPESMQQTAAAPPPPPRPAPKQFVPPPSRPLSTALSVPAPEPPPDIRIQAPRLPAGGSVLDSRLGTKPQPLAFVPPEQRPARENQEPRLIDALPTVAVAGSGAPVPGAITGSGVKLSLPEPPPVPSPGGGAGSGSGVPSKAPQVGAPSSGVLTGRADAIVPGVVVRPSAPPAAPAAPSPERTLVLELQLPPAAATISAPLRPSSRIVPPVIERRFPTRVLYTIAVPKPNLPMYTGDWVIWFAERQEQDKAGRIQAPLPYRKFQPVGKIRQEVLQGWVQVALVITKEGKPDSAAVLTPAAPEVATAALQDLLSWQFHPAMRNGQPIDVDAVVEIPFGAAR